MANADLPVHVDCQPFANSYAPVLGEVVPVANRVDAGVVVGGDGVQGVALLNPMDNTDGLGSRDCCGTVGAWSALEACAAATDAVGCSVKIDNALPGRNFVRLVRRFHFRTWATVTSKSRAMLATVSPRCTM